MNKLTAEKCREQFEEWASTEFDTRLIKFHDGEYKSQALHRMWLSWQDSCNALQILEQQDYEKSIIAGQLEAVRDSLSLTPQQDAIIRCAIDRLNVLTLMTLELSQSLIKQQDRGEWIAWGGGERPIHEDTTVKVMFSDGGKDGPGPSYLWGWERTGHSQDIIAYRIIPERATNQNGEQ